MPRFEVTGKGETTGRQRKRVYEASTEEDARLQAEAEGTAVSAVVALPPELPTEAQIKTAQEHRIDVPAGVTKDELCDFISLNTWRDKRASPDLQTIAAEYGVKVTRYSGKRLLFQRIFDRLSQPGHEEDLASWFAYRVYRELVGGSPESSVKTPNDPLIKTIARQLAGDSSAIQSICRYGGDDLIWFGRWTAPSGTIHEGGSNRTTAYKMAAELLRPHASSEKRGLAAGSAKRYNERPVHSVSAVASEPAKGIGVWLARAEETMRVRNSKPVKVTRTLVVGWVVVAVLLGIIVFGP